MYTYIVEFLLKHIISVEIVQYYLYNTMIKCKKVEDSFSLRKKCSDKSIDTVNYDLIPTSPDYNIFKHLSWSTNTFLLI